jgi:hypothetical protein
VSAPSLREELIEVARRHASERGWSWLEPVEVSLERATPGDRTWSVSTNILAVGQNVRVLIREADLAVLDAGFLSR